MPELDDLLAAEAARYDIRHVPVEVIRRRRRRRVAARAGGALAAVAAVGAAALLLPGVPGGGRDGVVAIGGGPDGPRVEAVRTDPDGRGLVATYTGGACDGPASLVVDERDDRVNVAVRIARRPGDDETTVCPAIGIGRHLRARLDELLAGRAVFANGERIETFDGADLVVPGRLPDGFILRSEGGSLEANAWTQTYGPPSADGLGQPCRPEQRSLSVSTGPRVHEAFSASYFRDEGPLAAGLDQARLYSQGDGQMLYLALRVGGQPVSLSYGADCGGPAPSLGELVEIAEALEPVRP